MSCSSVCNSFRSPEMDGPWWWPLRQVAQVDLMAPWDQLAWLLLSFNVSIYSYKWFLPDLTAIMLAFNIHLVKWTLPLRASILTPFRVICDDSRSILRAAKLFLLKDGIVLSAFWFSRAVLIPVHFSCCHYSITLMVLWVPESILIVPFLLNVFIAGFLLATKNADLDRTHCICETPKWFWSEKQLDLLWYGWRNSKYPVAW
jgi:hypothetical protein